MKFSIIIPVYNVEKYLRQCLDSLQKQVYENFEVIIVNDGSPDQSQVIIDEFVQKDARFFGYQKENGGLSDARNYGVEKATGDYLLFVDGDDYISPDYLKSIEETVSNTKFNERIDQHGFRSDNGLHNVNYQCSNNHQQRKRTCLPNNKLPSFIPCSKQRNNHRNV